MKRSRPIHPRCDLPLGKRRSVPDYLDDVRRLIAKRGHAIQIVLPNPGEVGWAYTVGLHGHGLPELIVVGGLSITDHHEMLDEVADRMRGGERITHGQRDGTLLVGFEVMFIEVADTTTEDFAVAKRLQSDFRALQIVWPDHDHRWPWEAGYAIPAWHQRLLGLPPVDGTA